MTDETEWVILDTETDGLSYPIHVVEIAAQRMRGAQKDGEPFQVFLNHGVPIPPDTTAIHGYSEGFLREHGTAPREAHEGLRAYVEHRYVVAHFMSYDWNAALLPEWRRLRIDHIGNPGFCSWMLSKRSIPELHSHKLDVLRQHFTLPCSRPHSALGDVESVSGLLQNVVFPRLAERGLATFQDIREFSKLKPILRCHCTIDGRDFSSEMQRIREEKRLQRAQEGEKDREREELTHRYRSGPTEELPVFLKEHRIISEDPDVKFSGRTFLFTGKMIWGTRPQASRLVTQLGGTVSKSKVVPSAVDYLVLGEDQQKGWTTLFDGGKLSEAVQKKINDEDCKLCLVLESDFIAALRSALEAEKSEKPLPTL